MKLGSIVGVSATAAVLGMDKACGFQVSSTARYGILRSSCRRHSNRWAVAPRRRGWSLPLLCTPPTSDVRATAGDSTSSSSKPKRKMGHGGMGKPDPNSFVQGDMRRAAMKLHTRDQSPREGGQETQGKKFSEWVPTRKGYLQFLVDSREVYNALEEVCQMMPALVAFRDTGLERTAALDKDIAWMLETYNDELGEGVEAGVGVGGKPQPSKAGVDYAAFLRKIAASSLPAFMCHFYNHYFAHTAGGLMIGRMVAKSCFDGRTLEFYKWEKNGGDVRALLDATRKNIDVMADGWGLEEKEACIAETANSFKFGGALVSSIKE